jgi:uncharacterized protein (DUF1697 family)
MLRGINVSGHNLVSMAALRDAFGALGLADVTTYLQSGNVVFSAPGRTTAARLEQTVAAGLQADLDLDVPVIVRSRADMAGVVVANPFVADVGDVTKLHVTFLKTTPRAKRVVELEAADFGREKLAVIGREVHLLCPDGYGRTKLGPAVLERRLDTTSTTRNWKSVTAIGKLLAS